MIRPLFHLLNYILSGAYIQCLHLLQHNCYQRKQEDYTYCMTYPEALPKKSSSTLIKYEALSYKGSKGLGHNSLASED